MKRQENSFIDRIGRLLVPRSLFGTNLFEKFQEITTKINYTKPNNKLFGYAFFLSVIVNFVFYLVFVDNARQITENLILINEVFFGIIFFFVVLCSLYVVNYIIVFIVYFYYKAVFEKIQREVEESLPEFLDNLASEIRGGVPLEEAILKSVRENQASLLKEVIIIHKKLTFGSDIKTVLNEFGEKFSTSSVISQTIFLIEEGIEGGGNLSEPLRKISENLKNKYQLHKEIKASSSGSILVIKLISQAVAPLLFALALNLLSFISDLLFLLGDNSNNSFNFLQNISPEFRNSLFVFSCAMIFLNSFFCALINITLKNEENIELVKLIPINLIISFSLFLTFNKILSSVFGNIL